VIVEDEVMLNDAYCMILKKAGYKVTQAYDGSEALKLLTDNKEEPDLILLDLRMPKMNGIDFLKKYKLKEDPPNVKVIVCSNLDMQKEIDEAYERGAQTSMPKALAAPKELVKLVGDTLSGK